MTDFYARGYKTKLTREKMQEILGETMPVPITEQLLSSISVQPHNWKTLVADYIAAEKYEEAQLILDAVGTAAEDAINQVNTLAANHNLLGYWL